MPRKNPKQQNAKVIAQERKDEMVKEKAQKIHELIGEPELLEGDRGFYVPFDVSGDEKTPQFVELQCKDTDRCDTCKYDDGDDYGMYDSVCSCDENRIVHNVMRIVSVIGRPIRTKPIESIYNVQIFKFSCKACDVNWGYLLNADTLSSDGVVATSFSIQDAIMEYTGNESAELVNEHLTTPMFRCFCPMPNGKYVLAYNNLVEKIILQKVIVLDDQNPHIGQKKKKGRN